MPMLDWIFVAVFCISLLAGLWRGLVYELLSVVNWIAAFVLAQWFAPVAAQWLPLDSATEVVRYGAGFVLVFVLSLFAGGLVAFLISKLVAAGAAAGGPCIGGRIWPGAWRGHPAGAGRGGRHDAHGQRAVVARVHRGRYCHGVFAGPQARVAARIWKIPSLSENKLCVESLVLSVAHPLTN